MKNKNYIIGFIIIVTTGLLFKVLFFNKNNLNYEGNNSIINYQLDISPGNLEILNKCRLSAIEKGVLTDENQTYVDANLKVNESKYPVKIKLKGALRGHWIDSIRWSFRVVIQDGFCIENGLKVFSIQSGSQRGNLVEHYYHHFLKSYGIIYLHYSRINFSINSDSLENYAIEEFFDSPLLTHNNRPEGPIIKFVYDDYWETVKWMDPNLTMLSIMEVFDKTYHTAPIKSFKLKSGKIDNWKKLSKKASKQLNKFRKGRLQANEVFDLELMGKYFAINTLFGSQHPAFVTNLRFYYNPKTELIEPIGYDMELIRDLTLANEKDRKPNYWPNKVSLPLFTSQLFSDSLMQMSYTNSLTELLNNTEIDKLQEIFHDDIEYYENLSPIKLDNHIDLLKSNLNEIRLELELKNKE